MVGIRTVGPWNYRAARVFFSAMTCLNLQMNLFLQISSMLFEMFCTLKWLWLLFMHCVIVLCTGSWAESQIIQTLTCHQLRAITSHSCDLSTFLMQQARCSVRARHVETYLGAHCCPRYAWFYWTIIRGLGRSFAASRDPTRSCEGLQDLASCAEISQEFKRADASIPQM